ncbi:MAG: NlpC/P60 family protein [Gordonia sp. (in: high G+C Gram-positive bacteria)]
MVAVALLGVLGASPATATPSGKHHTTPSAPVNALINQIATVNQNITDLDSAVAIRQENVNRAIADYQNALVAEHLASIAARGAALSLAKASRETVAAQRKFDAFIRSAYRNGTAVGSMTNYVSADNPQLVLERLTAIDRIARTQQANIRRLQVARNEQANRVSELAAMKRQASLASVGAAGRRDDALAAVAAARAAMLEQQRKRASLIAARDSVQAQLDKLRGVTAPKRAAAPSNAGPSNANLLSNLFPNLPGIPGTPAAAPGATQTAGADNQALRVAAEAAGRLALNVGQKLLAQLVGQLQIPHSQLLDALGVGGSTLGSVTDKLSSSLGSSGSSGSDFGSSSLGSLGSLFGSSSGLGAVRPGLRGPQAVEIVVNRALSQLNVPYAWGGGDANGPTLGIRDGGVADKYGDYKKVGFDCSGLMVYAFAGVGIQLPHYTGYQYTSGPQVPLAQMRRGDMIFYGPNASEHVALYLGDNKMVEAPQSGDVVKVSPLRTAGAMPNVVRLL